MKNRQCNRSWMSHALFRLAGRLPCRLINRFEQGSEKRYLERYYVGSLFGVTAYLHRFVAGDGDEWVHDHPWDYAAAVVLSGAYLEERLLYFDAVDGWVSKWRRLGGWRRLNVLRAGDFHRIEHVRPETWTLFLHMRRSKRWGFLSRIPGSAGAVYQQPYEVQRNANWHERAALGNAVDRAPWGGV